MGVDIRISKITAMDKLIGYILLSNLKLGKPLEYYANRFLSLQRHDIKSKMPQTTVNDIIYYTACSG